MNACFYCKHESPAAHHDRVVYNKTALHGDWTGWRMAGRDLVAPNGVRFRPERLQAIAWAEKRATMHTRKPVAPCPVFAQVRLPARERFEGCA